MKDIKLVVTGDTHLAVSFPIHIRQFRVNDFNNIFKQIIDFSINEKVDAILFLGDLFDTYRPEPNVVNFVRYQIYRLKKNNIKFYTIFGNHDFDGNIDNIKYGTAIDYVKLVDDSILDIIDPVIDKYKGIDNIGYRLIKDNIRVYGVGCYKDNTINIIKKYFTKIDNSYINILLLHNFIQKVNDLPYSRETKIPIDEIDSIGFDIVCPGHLHIFRNPDGIYKTDGTLYLCPGSPVSTTFEQLGTGGFYLLTINTENRDIKYEFKNVESKYYMTKIVVQSKEKESYEYYIEEINRKISEIISMTKKKLILSVNIRGKISDIINKLDPNMIASIIMSKYKDNILFLSDIKIRNLEREYLEELGEPVHNNIIDNTEIIKKLFSKYFSKEVSDSLTSLYNIIQNTYEQNYSRLLKSGDLPKSIREPLNKKIRDEILFLIRDKRLIDIINSNVSINKKEVVEKDTEDGEKRVGEKSISSRQQKHKKVEKKSRRSLENFFGGM